MNPNWLGVVSGILAVVAFGAVYQRAKRATPERLRWPLFLSVVASMPGAGFTIYYAHLFPEAGWFYQFRSVPGTEFLVIFIGVAGGIFAALLPRLLLVIPLLGVVLLSIAPIAKPFIGPIQDGTLKDEWDREICLQSSPSTCGAASMATILKYLGSDVTESELAAEAHSYAGGTEAWYLARAARSRGFKVQFDFESGFSPEGGLPAVVGVRLGSIGHFIAILRAEGDRFLVGDPLNGREILSRGDLLTRYKFSGFHMRVRSRGH